MLFKAKRSVQIGYIIRGDVMCGTVIKTDSNTQSVGWLKIFSVVISLDFLNEGSVFIVENSSFLFQLEMQFISNDKQGIEIFFFCVLLIRLFRYLQSIF